MKLCECGCGKPSPIAKKTDSSTGRIKGQPMRFLSGHNRPRLTHGMARKIVGRQSPEYEAFCNAKMRCENPQRKDHANYGGRGIKFLFDNFDQFYAELGQRPSPAYSVDRIDNGGNYAPGNVRWATRKEQRANGRPAASTAA